MGEDEDDDEDDDDDVDRWWGIWQPDEIRRLADWIAIKNGLGEGKRLTTDTKSNGHDKQAVAVPDARGPSAASANTSGSSSNLTPLSIPSDTEDELESDSSLSSVSGEESDGEPNGVAQMRGGDDARPLPSPNELKTLVKALIEYAEVLDWRVWRMQEEPGRGSKEDRAAKDKDKPKAAGGRVRAISPANFYGA